MADAPHFGTADDDEEAEIDKVLADNFRFPPADDGPATERVIEFDFENVDDETLATTDDGLKVLGMRYTPGSPDAKKFGCTCPELENVFGDGVKNGEQVFCEVHGLTDETVFTCDEDCLLHSHLREDDDEDELADES